VGCFFVLTTSLFYGKKSTTYSALEGDMQIIVEVWGGLFFLANKFLFAASERVSDNPEVWRLRRMGAWACYLIGIGPWLFIFWQNDNWIALGVELSGIPALFLGLFLAYIRSVDKVPQWFNRFALVGVGLGLVMSLWALGGFSSASQFCELGLSLGFLYGTYRLALNKQDGYIGLLVMNLSNAYLMHLQGYQVLVWQQIVSASIVVWAYYSAGQSKPQ
jgi:hypothetical protein